MIKTFRFKRKTYIPSLLCALLLTACSQNNNPEQQNETAPSQTENSSAASDKNSASDSNMQTTESISLIDDGHPITELSESTLDLSTYGLDYEYTTDAQPEYQWTSVARGEKGYYFWDEGEITRLMYLDTPTGKYVPLCNKPNCDHNNQDCNAYFANIDVINYQTSYIQYYDGHIYVIGYDTDGYIYLYQIASDGSTRKKYMTLYKADLSVAGAEGKNQSHFRAPYVCIHRGYVYFIDNKESTLKIRRMKLGEDDSEVVFENAGNRPNLYRMKAYGDYLLFQSGNFIDDDYFNIEAGIFALNVNTVEVQLIKKEAIADYTISDAFLYYSTTSGINRYSLKDMTDKSIIDNGLNEMLEVQDGKIYCFNDDTKSLSQYNSEGRLLNKITDKHLYQCCMGDSEYLFARGTTGTKIISVNELSKENAKWKTLK